MLAPEAATPIEKCVAVPPAPPVISGNVTVEVNAATAPATTKQEESRKSGTLAYPV